MELNMLLLIIFGVLLFTGIFGKQDISSYNLVYIGYGAYVMNKEGRLGRKKKIGKKDKVKGGNMLE